MDFLIAFGFGFIVGAFAGYFFLALALLTHKNDD